MIETKDLELVGPKEAMSILQINSYRQLYKFVKKEFIKGYMGKNKRFKFDKAELENFYSLETDISKIEK